MDIVIFDSDTIAPTVRRALVVEGHRVRVADEDDPQHACDLVVLDVDHRPGDAAVVAQRRPDAALLFLVNDLGKPLPSETAMAMLKPLDPNKLVRMVRAIEGARSGTTDPRELVDFETLFCGESPAIIELLRQVHLIARSDAPVWLHGELGTGRAVVARAIHESSARREQLFMAVNAASLPGDQLEEHLFGGYEPTVKRAHRGTLFIDSVTELAPGVQAKLLRLLEERRLRLRETDHEVDVRVMVADERRTMNVGGRLRKELYFQLRVHELDLPPLRERARDLGAIITRMLERLQRDGRPAALSTAARRALEGYAFPGNVRELADALTHAIILSRGGPIEMDHLPADIRGGSKPDGEIEVDVASLGPLDEVARRFERDYLLRVLRAVGGNRTRAASVLGLSRKGLWQKLKAHEIAPDEGRDAEAD